MQLSWGCFNPSVPTPKGKIRIEIAELFPKLPKEPQHGAGKKPPDGGGLCLSGWVCPFQSRPENNPVVMAQGYLSCCKQVDVPVVLMPRRHRVSN